MKKSVNIITLGCSKNLVDSEKLLKQLGANEFEVAHDSSEKSDIIIVNTCGFINDAKQESIDTILDAINAKKNGKAEKVYVTGCLSQRYADQLRSELPDVDDYFGAYDIKKILTTLNAEYRDSLLNERIVTTPSHIAYLKISEGCDRGCAFCSIPLIKGKHVSRSIEDVVEEAELLVSQGVKEILLIAQDLSFYGMDLYKERKLPEMLDKLSKIQGLEWIRLHYAYPNDFPEEVLELMAERDNICNYIDVPVQHISSKMLKIMRRRISKKATVDIINKFREKVPDVALRTTLLVGHPGEDEKDFEDLKKFVQSIKFDRLGVFTYSEEEGTHSGETMEDTISQEEKQRRADEIMAIQQDISYELNQKKVGKEYKTIIDRKEGDVYIGRTQYDSYEVDNEVIISDSDLEIGSFYNVKITKADDFDLYGAVK